MYDVARVFESLMRVSNAVPMLTTTLQIFVMPVTSGMGQKLQRITIETSSFHRALCAACIV